MGNKFIFGENWERYVEVYTERRLELAKKSLKDFMNIENLKDKLFLDIGCGSGLYSLAAHELGADVISFDTDSGCIKCCDFFRKRKNNPDNWKIYQGSVLDREFLKSLPKADIVYSHGVLHHTGKMWEAMENVKHLVKDNGYLYIAIYNKMYGLFNGSKAWEFRKRLYNRLPKVFQYLWQGLYTFRHKIIPYIIRLRNPIKEWKNFSKSRGESYWIDLRDWLGAHPYEYARPDEVFNFYKNEFILENIITKNSLGLNSFLFRKKSKKN